MTSNPSEAFQAILKALRDQCLVIGKSLISEEKTQRQWMLPPGEWDGDLFKPENIEKAFNRKQANEDYAAALHEEGTMGEAMAAKVQIDYLACQERAFRARHSTPVRAAAHAASRRLGHGNEAGVHTGVVLQHVVDLLASGQSAAAAAPDSAGSSLQDASGLV